MRLLLPALLLAGLALPAAASAADPRLVTLPYRADQVVRIDGRAGVQATVMFADDEQIENVAIGDSNAWQVTPNKRANMLFVKPLAPAARTNMTVVTSARTYVFDLVAAANARTLYVLRFAYPDAPKPAAAPEVPALTTEEAALAAGVAPALPDPEPAREINRAWTRKGKAALLPASVHDDGEATFLAWEPGRPVPAILIRNERGEEGPVNFAVRSDTIVIDGVPATIILRSGKDSATIERQMPRTAARGDRR